MIGLRLNGWDGSVWDLRFGPVRATSDGIEGLGGLNFEVFVQETAARHGQRMTGWRGKPRDFLLPVLFGPFPDEGSWTSISRRWWKIMRPDKYNTLVITHPDGTERMLDIRFVDDGAVASNRDPTRDLIETFPIRLVADNPWFYGKSFGRKFKAAPPAGPTAPGVNFFGGLPVDPAVPGKGTPLVLGASQRTSQNEYTNPGDDDAWPTYTFGQMDRFTARLGTGIVSASSLVVEDGETLTVETSPLRQVALLTRVDGTVVNVTRRLDGWGFRPVPAGSKQTILLDVDGRGDYEVSLIPHFFRGW